MGERELDISILLTTYNRSDECIRCLDTLIPQLNDKIEILLLDDWHLESDNLKQYCKKHNLKYVHTGKQKNGVVRWRVPGFAYNIGAKLAKGNYFIIGGAEILHLCDNTIKLMYETNIASAPTVYDEIKPGSTKFDKLNNKLPFCFGLPKDIYFKIGGYDEDFIGYCFDDNDFSDRVLSMVDFITVPSEVVHLWNLRGANNRGDSRITNKAWEYNRKLYMKRKNIIIRNKDKEWGIL